MVESPITKQVIKSFNLIGLKRKCHFKEFSSAVPATRAELYERFDSMGASTEIIFYLMTEEELHPERQEIFYLGIESRENDATPEGMEYKKIENQPFVMTTHKGDITDVWKSYQRINEYIKKNELTEDRTSYVVELYDKRFSSNSTDSEMEIYIPLHAK